MTAQPAQVRDILIADDHPMLVQAVAALVAAKFPAARVRTATDFTAAVAEAVQTPPQLALIDGDMPGATAFSGVAAIIAAAPGALVIVVSGLRDDALVADLLAAGAAGFVPKSESPAVMLAAIDLVLAGGCYRPETLVPDLAVLTPSPPILSRRLGGVARLLGEGLTNKEIARTLGVSPETIKTQVAQLLAVVGAANRAEAAVKARSLIANGRDLPGPPRS